MDEETITISKKEYTQLKKDADKLECLEAGGVDNWPHYSDSLRDNGFFKRWYGDDE